jgi:TATA-binding protein-associated factor Taf7
MGNKEKKQEQVDTREIEREEEEETETEDIYDEKERDRMLQEDEITEAEEAFMEGQEKALGKSRPPLRKRHRDTISVQLAEQAYKED